MHLPRCGMRVIALRARPEARVLLVWVIARKDRRLVVCHIPH